MKRYLIRLWNKRKTLKSITDKRLYVALFLHSRLKNFNKEKTVSLKQFFLFYGELYFQVQHFNKKKSSYKNCCIMKLAKKKTGVNV